MDHLSKIENDIIKAKRRLKILVITLVFLFLSEFYLAFNISTSMTHAIACAAVLIILFGLIYLILIATEEVNRLKHGKRVTTQYYKNKNG